MSNQSGTEKMATLLAAAAALNSANVPFLPNIRFPKYSGNKYSPPRPSVERQKEIDDHNLAIEEKRKVKLAKKAKQ